MKAYQIMEEIINEVSVNKWKEAAKNSIEGRRAKAEEASDRFGSVVYPFRPEVNDPGHKLANAWDKAEQRADRAEQLAKNLPNSNRSANELKNAAKKVIDKRDKDNEEAVDKLQNAVDKFKEKSYDERTDKDYSDLAKVQNEWVNKQKKENRARNLVGKPERRPEKNSEGKHKLKEQGYIDRTNEALDIMEEIINEVSIGMWKKAATSSLPKRQEEAEVAKKAAEQGWEEYDKQARKHPEEEPALYRLAQANDEAGVKSEDRAEHAKDVSKLMVHNKANANKAIKAAKKVSAKREDTFGGAPSAKTLKRSVKANQLVYADPKYKNEALSLAESIIGYADNIFELDYENKQNVNTNKIRKLKKDKDGENVEVVSVADELFPYEGNAKQQFNQKVLAKINDMIEGKGSLEDLIQFVRKYSGNRKSANESTEISEAVKLLEEMINIVEGRKEGESLEDYKNRIAGEQSEAQHKKYVDTLSKLIYSEQHDKKHGYKFPRESSQRTQNLEKKAQKQYDNFNKASDIQLKNAGLDVSKWKRKSQEDMIGQDYHGLKAEMRADNKANEAIELMEDIYSQIKKVYGEPEYKYDKDSGLKPANKSAELMYKADEVRGKEYSQEKEKNPNIDLYKKRLTTKNTRGKNKTEYRSSKYRKFSDDWRLPKTDDERIEGSIRRHNEKVNKSLKEALEEIKQVAEGLFVKDGRGDLLNDIDNALGSPVKKTVKGMVKQCTGCKQKKVNEVFDNSEEKVYNKNNIINLLEEIINEVSDKFIRDKIKNSEEEIDNNEEIKKQLRTEESKKKVDDTEIPLKHKLEVLKNKFEDRVMKRAKAEEDDSKKKEGN